MAVLDLVIGLVLAAQALRKRQTRDLFNLVMHLICMMSCPYPTAEVEIANNIIIGDHEPQQLLISRVEIAAK